jgi:hypothetical protein
MEIKHGDGKLYRVGSEQLVSAVEFKLYEELDSGSVRWWGELYLDTNLRIKEDNRYIVEFEDGRKGRCYVQRLSNRVLVGMPSRHMYRFSGISPLASGECKGEGDKGGEVD